MTLTIEPQECCEPTCSTPATELFDSPVPLCEHHIYGVFSATQRYMKAAEPLKDEYELIPNADRQMPGPCPACGLCGYLAVTVSDRVHCLNSGCYYEAWIDQFEPLRRTLLFDLAGTSDVVYYIKFRDQVKIGTTRNLRKRWVNLQTTELLYGFEFGSHAVEAARHRQFARFRRTGEWFEDNQHLRAHINNVCATAIEPG